MGSGIGGLLHAIRELFIDALTPAQLAAARELADALGAHLAAPSDQAHAERCLAEPGGHGGWSHPASASDRLPPPTRQAVSGCRA